MQLDDFYIGILQISLLDAIAIGAAAGMIAATCFGFKLKRRESDHITWLLGGAAATIFGTIIGYCVMNLVGYVVIWTGSPIQGLAGTDLLDWETTLVALYAPYQMHAAGFALVGALLGIGLGYGIGERPEDTSRLGNLIATFGVIAIVAGLLFMFLPSFITLPSDTAFLYLLLLNGLLVLGYGIRYLVNRPRGESPPEYTSSQPEELIM
ncbi:hypothetical protein E4H12_08255 [Candidatus Thorarchaeota archaeon]|nr:hypothetical protein [Candidatus Thorarchaeota archaeon]TFG97574.1 MAG: hypothetical protein E4H12_08255 [Candidatus Thorarchaeota archaeon]